MKNVRDIIKEQGEDSFKINVITVKDGCRKFANLTEARKVYPTLDPYKNTKDFTWAMKDGDWLRFEDWPTENMLST